MTSDIGLIPLIEKEEIENGTPSDFNGRLTSYQMFAVKRALSESVYKALSYKAKEAVQEELVESCIELYTTWKQDDSEFDLRHSHDMNDMVWMLKKYIEHVLAVAHNLTMEQ